MNVDFRADLHCHSTCSDGTFTPRQLVEMAVSSGLKGLAITDHDSISSFPEAFVAAEEAGVKLITGLELSTIYNEESVHILGYSFQADHPAIIDFCAKHYERRQARIGKILVLLKQNGMTITLEDLREVTGPNNRSIGRPHIAMAMIKKGYVKDMKEAFRRFLGDRKVCFVPGGMPSSGESIDVIHKSGGYAVLAHPHLMERNRTVRRVIELGCDGIECFYAKMPRDTEQRWIDLAKEKNIFATGGSDFHGDAKSFITLGCSWTGKELFDILYDRFLDNNPQISQLSR